MVHTFFIQFEQKVYMTVKFRYSQKPEIFEKLPIFPKFSGLLRIFELYCYVENISNFSIKWCTRGTVWKCLTCITQLFSVNIRPEILAKVIPSTFILWAITVSLTFRNQFEIAFEQDVVWDPKIWVKGQLNSKGNFGVFKSTKKERIFCKDFCPSF